MPEVLSASLAPLIRVEMLGGFKIIVDDVVISDDMARTRQLWNLLEYLITYRKKSISNDELISVLWPNDSSGQPSNALKNLIYRIRTLFVNSQIPFAREIISYDHGAYAWNRLLPTQVDIEEFDRIYQETLDKTLTDEARSARYETLLDLYKGDYLSNSRYEEWIVPIATYYRSLYFKCVHEQIAILKGRREYGAIELICKKAAIIDRFEETVHINLIEALIHQGKQAQALSHYNYVTDLFYSELGVSPSESLRRLYREISKTINSVEMDLRVIKEDLNESVVGNSGAYYCEYEVFKNIYRIEARSAARSGQAVYLALITMTDLEDKVPPVKQLNKMMSLLLEVIRRSLRKGDVVARFSATQYVLMLPTLTFENGQMVIDRILKRFRAEYGSHTVKIYSKLLPLDPIK